MIGTMTITDEPRHAIPSSCDPPSLSQTSPTRRRPASEMVAERKPKRKKVEVVIVRSSRAKNGGDFRDESLSGLGVKGKGKQEVPLRHKGPDRSQVGTDDRK